MKLIKFFSHSKTRGIHIDDPILTQLRREIISEKAFLKKLYEEWYAKVLKQLDDQKNVLELGSGGGFMADFISELITSEVIATKDVKMVVNACEMPFDDNQLSAIVMTDVFHHIPDVESFLKEATRVIRNKGKIIMIEPWRTPWSEVIYSNFHSEPFDIHGGWRLDSNIGPLSSANGALPWIVFERDKDKLISSYPAIKINNINLMMPFSYLLSGGVSMKSFAPGFLYKPIRFIENKFNQKRWAMFALIEIEINKV
jgi:SAM-dependent methyltransferase